MAWPALGSMVPAVTPDATSPAKLASAVVAGGALVVVVVVGDDVDDTGREVAVEPAWAEGPAVGVPPVDPRATAKPTPRASNTMAARAPIRCLRTWPGRGPGATGRPGATGCWVTRVASPMTAVASPMTAVAAGRPDRGATRVRSSRWAEATWSGVGLGEGSHGAANGELLSSAAT